MLISHETPLCMLETSHIYNCYDYALVHLLPIYEQYKDFYLNSVKKGRHVLLDNSIFELGEAYNAEQFAVWVTTLKPTEYIVPDSLENTEKTITSFEAFTRSFHGLKGKKIGVVQGKTYQELVECYKFMSDKADKIAISFDYSFYLENCDLFKSQVCKELGFKETDLNKWSKYALGRLQLLWNLNKDEIFNTSKPHHLLGCSVPWEFKMLRHFGVRDCIESIDTSNPIVAGMIGAEYDDVFGLKEKWSFKLVDFINNEVDERQKLLSYKNIRKFRNLCA